MDIYTDCCSNTVVGFRFVHDDPALGEVTSSHFLLRLSLGFDSIASFDFRVFSLLCKSEFDLVFDLDAVGESFDSFLLLLLLPLAVLVDFVLCCGFFVSNFGLTLELDDEDFSL